MSCSCGSTDPQLCGCCDSVQAETPEIVTNRPALSAVGYRVGRYSTFYRSMLAALSRSSLPALGPLRTRDSSDFSIALLDSWAVILDTLTFYQERIVNESYLRCALDDRSVLELAALVGYRPSPGVAASTTLAFSLNPATGAPDPVPIPAGTRVQSVPGPGEMPQTFETSTDLLARVRHNALAIQMTTPWSLASGQTSITIAGISSNLSPGDALLFVTDALRSSALGGTAPGAGAQADLHFVSAISIDSKAKTTLVIWDRALSWPTSGDTNAGIYLLSKRSGLFGSLSPDPRAFTVTTGSGLNNVIGWPTTAASAATADWTFTAAFSDPKILLDSTVSGLAPSSDASAEPQWVVLADEQSGTTAVFAIAGAQDISPNAFLLNGKSTQLTLRDGLTVGASPVAASTTLRKNAVTHTRSAIAYVLSSRLTPADGLYQPPAGAWKPFSGLTVSPTLPLPVLGPDLPVLAGQQLLASQPVAINGFRLRMSLKATAGSAQATFTPSGQSTALRITNGDIYLIDTFPPLADPSSGDPLWQVLTPSGIYGLLNAKAYAITLLAADAKNDPPASEAALIATVGTQGPITTVTLTAPLTRAYDRTALTINANAVLATNGETTNEILGNGDATNPALSFTLKQKPLTYIASGNANGVQSTLQVWVNNLRWQEEDNLLSAAPADRVFTSSARNGGNVAVTFGDGITGNRTPSGQMNIRAVYRKGVGSAGNVAAGKLTMAIDRPQGLQTVTNPQRATGGGNPASHSEVRAQVPLPTLTIGRVVSLLDYQNFALNFAGIGKALASWERFGSTRGVLLTVAAPDGSLYKPTDSTIIQLSSALLAAGSPLVPLQIVSYTPRLFEVAANLQIDTTQYDASLVLAAVWQALAGDYSFSNAVFGNGIAQSQIIRTIQQVPGVLALELTRFNRQGGSPSIPLPAFLRASSPVGGGNLTPGAPPPVGAELLTLDPTSQANLVEGK